MVDVDQFMGQVLADEGWQDRLGDSDAVAAVIRCLEDRLPAGSSLPEAEAERIRAVLHGDAVGPRLLEALQAR